MSRHSPIRTGDQALVREINLSLIMNYLREHAPVSRAALAEMTGLNKTTVSSLVRELIDYHFVHEVGLDTAGVGRPAVLLELNPAAGHIVSVDIGVDYISVIRANFAAEVVWRHRESIRHSSRDAIITRLLNLICEAARPEGNEGPLLGVAVGVPGLVDESNGTLLFAPNLGWRDVPMRAIVQEVCTAPVFVDNEANMAALGEYYFGSAQGCDDVLYISVEVGLGGAIVRNGVLFKGRTGFAGEFGHMTLKPDGELCNCGNRGCWETLVSQSAVFRSIRRAIESGRSSILTEMLNGDLDRLTIPHVVEAARQGDPVTLDVLNQVGHYLGIGIASLVNALNPELVVFGGMLSLAADFLLPAVEEEMKHRALKWNAEAVRVVLARHGSDACVMGGVATVWQAILSQPANMAPRMG